MNDPLATTKEESFSTVNLEPEKVRFVYQGENLTLRIEGGEFYPRVTLRRCFPLSAKRRHILVRAPQLESQEEHELGLIDDLEALDPDSQNAIVRELQLHYFVPTIQRINTIREEFGFLYWNVETDRGPKEFVMRDSIISSIRQVSERRWLMIDINQTRYEVRDLAELDKRSQDLLRLHLLL